MKESKSKYSGIFQNPLPEILMDVDIKKKSKNVFESFIFSDSDDENSEKSSNDSKENDSSISK